MAPSDTKSPPRKRVTRSPARSTRTRTAAAVGLDTEETPSSPVRRVTRSASKSRASKVLDDSPVVTRTTRVQSKSRTSKTDPKTDTKTEDVPTRRRVASKARVAKQTEKTDETTSKPVKKSASKKTESAKHLSLSDSEEERAPVTRRVTRLSLARAALEASSDSEEDPKPSRRRNIRKEEKEEIKEKEEPISGIKLAVKDVEKENKSPEKKSTVRGRASGSQSPSPSRPVRKNTGVSAFMRDESPPVPRPIRTRSRSAHARAKATPATSHPTQVYSTPVVLPPRSVLSHSSSDDEPTPLTSSALHNITLSSDPFTRRIAQDVFDSPLSTSSSPLTSPVKTCSTDKTGGALWLSYVPYALATLILSLIAAFVPLYVTNKAAHSLFHSTLANSHLACVIPYFLRFDDFVSTFSPSTFDLCLFSTVLYSIAVCVLNLWRSKQSSPTVKAFACAASRAIVSLSLLCLYLSMDYLELTIDPTPLTLAPSSTLAAFFIPLMGLSVAQMTINFSRTNVAFSLVFIINAAVAYNALFFSNLFSSLSGFSSCYTTITVAISLIFILFAFSIGATVFFTHKALRTGTAYTLSTLGLLVMICFPLALVYFVQDHQPKYVYSKIINIALLISHSICVYIGSTN